MGDASVCRGTGDGEAACFAGLSEREVEGVGVAGALMESRRVLPVMLLVR